MKQIQILTGLLLFFLALTVVAEPELLLQTRDLQTKISAYKMGHLKLDCQGRKAKKWRIKMNLKKNKMWVKLKNALPYSLPITFSQWNGDNPKRILIVAGKNKKHIKATINRTHTCRLDFSRLRYTYSISAKVARVGHFSGCCSGSSITTSINF